MGRIKGSKNKPKPVSTWQNPEIVSSYRENELGKTFYDIVMELKPRKVIEFGTLNGYSAVCIGMALKELGQGHLYSYDLWEAYKYSHATKAEAQENLDKYGVSDYVTLGFGDIGTWIPETCDLIHMDISNDGEKLRTYEPKLRATGALVVFEGGSRDRDNVQWMHKYNKQPITTCGVRYEVINPLFPSMSKLI